MCSHHTYKEREYNNKAYERNLTDIYNHYTIESVNNNCNAEDDIFFESIFVNLSNISSVSIDET